MNITIKKIDKKEIEERRLNEILNDISNGIVYDMNIISLFDEKGKELGYAIISPKGSFNIDKTFHKHFDGLYDYSKKEYENLYQLYKNDLYNSSYLCFIQANDKNKGIGTILMNKIKDEYNNIWLYSVSDSEEFYIKNNFTEISYGDHSFIYNGENNTDSKIVYYEDAQIIKNIA